MPVEKDGSAPRPSSSSAVAVDDGSAQVTPQWSHARYGPGHRLRCDVHNGRMRVLVCPDKFAGTISAVAAAEAFAAGWHAVKPDDEVVLRPLSDGGPGFVAVLAAALPDAKLFAMEVRRVI